jgi:hypothetical protein
MIIAIAATKPRIISKIVLKLEVASQLIIPHPNIKTSTATDKNPAIYI